VGWRWWHETPPTVAQEDLGGPINIVYIVDRMLSSWAALRSFGIGLLSIRLFFHSARAAPFAANARLLSRFSIASERMVRLIQSAQFR
jgi:hypothetical protein